MSPLITVDELRALAEPPVLIDSTWNLAGPPGKGRTTPATSPARTSSTWTPSWPAHPVPGATRCPQQRP